MAYNYHAITARSHWQVVLDEVKNYLELLCGNHSGGNLIVVVSFPDSHNPTRYTASWRYVSPGMKRIPRSKNEHEDCPKISFQEFEISYKSTTVNERGRKWGKNTSKKQHQQVNNDINMIDKIRLSQDEIKGREEWL